MTIQELCREMSLDKNILTFSEIGKALAEGALLGRKYGDPVSGAVINLSLLAAQRAIKEFSELKSTGGGENDKNPKGSLPKLNV